MPETDLQAAPVSWACPTCQGPVATTWLFCESCGTDFRVSRPNQVVRAQPLPVVQTVSRFSGWRDRLPQPSADTGMIARVVGGVLAVVLIGVAITVHLQTRADLHRTERTLAATQEQLTGTRADLATSRTTLAGTQSDLADESAKLEETQGSLDDANDRLNLQTDQIEDLSSCLGGVQKAFSYFLDDYYDSALNSLYAVEDSCDRAYELF